MPNNLFRVLLALLIISVGARARALCQYYWETEGRADAILEQVCSQVPNSQLEITGTVELDFSGGNGQIVRDAYCFVLNPKYDGSNSKYTYFRGLSAPLITWSAPDTPATCGFAPHATPTPSPTPAVSPQIDQVRVAQVLWDPRTLNASVTSLALGKSAALEVSLSLPAGSPTTGSFVVNVDGLDQPVQSPTHYFSEFVNGKLKLDPFGLHFVPTKVGSLTLQTSVLASGASAVSGPSVNANVIKTDDLKIGMTKIFADQTSCPRGFCYPDISASDYQNQKGKQQFLESLFPVRDNGLSLNDETVISGSPLNKSPADYLNYKVFSQGILADMRLLQIENALYKMNRTVGLAGAGYFDYHHDLPLTLGLTIGKMAIVQANAQSVFAHEIVHTLTGMVEPCVEGYLCQENELVSGYDAKYGIYQNLKFSVMDYDYPVADAWIDPQHYSYVFDALSKPLIDPEILLVSGFLSKSGQFEFKDFIYLPDGNLDAFDSNQSFTISMKDQSGTPLFQTQFGSNFLAARTSSAPTAGPSVVSIDTVPLTLSLPYNSNVASVEVAFNGVTTSIQDPRSNMLTFAINSIATSAFKVNVIAARNRFNEELKRYAMAMSKKQYVNAAKVLSEINAEILKDTNDFAALPPVYSRASILKLVADLSSSLKLSGSSK